LNNKLRGILLLLVGFILISAGIVAVYLLTQQIIVPRILPISEQKVKSKVVIVLHDKALGDLLKPEDLSTLEVPAEMIPRDAVKTVEEAVNRYVKTDLVQGEIVLQHNLADPTNINHDLAFILSQEHVLMAFDSKDVMTNQGIVKRGDIIDILVSRSSEAKVQPKAGEAPPAEGEAKTTAMFSFDAFQNVGVTALVMDVAQDKNTTTEVKKEAASTRDIVIRSYLFAMKPQDALTLKYLKDTGAVFDIVLRAPTSTQKFELTPVTEEYITELYGLEILK
jgi:pilus assembly protein CpaB